MKIVKWYDLNFLLPMISQNYEKSVSVVNENPKEGQKYKKVKKVFKIEKQRRAAVRKLYA